MDGIIIIDKPKEYTSHDIVAVVKKITGEKIGHTGTLDPNATGVLPLLVGKATKISKYLINHDKTYIATVKLGIKTDTADGEGKIIQTQDVNQELLQKEIIENVLFSMVGKQEQLPPMYSAIKVKGKKLYEYAREGKTVEINPRTIEIYSMELLEIKKKDLEIVFKIDCSKGTYIRTVCENLAEKLHTIGYMKELRRTKVGEFTLENAVSINEIKDRPEIVEKKIISIEELLNNIPEIKLNNKDLKQFLHGIQLNQNLEDGLYRIYGLEFIGLGIISNKKLKRDVIINEL